MGGLISVVPLDASEDETNVSMSSLYSESGRSIPFTLSRYAE
jgi:hypothetical protein